MIKNNRSLFFIEAKDTNAQSGQFVLLTEDENRVFVFSPRNKSNQNEMTEIIINYMNTNYERYAAAGTAGEELDINKAVFINWIINYYEKKNVKYVITKFNNRMIILPINKFSDYFEVSAKFRIKKSGSREPSKKLLNDVINELKKFFPSKDIKIIKTGKKTKLFVENVDSTFSKTEFILEKYTYRFSATDKSNTFEIRQLSNTRNKNVIFSIKVKKEQDSRDLHSFLSEIQ